MVVACHRHPGVCLRHLIDRPSIGSMLSPSIRSFSKVELYLKYLNKKPGNHQISDDFTSELNRDRLVRYRRVISWASKETNTCHQVSIWYMDAWWCMWKDSRFLIAQICQIIRCEMLWTRVDSLDCSYLFTRYFKRGQKKCTTVHVSYCIQWTSMDCGFHTVCGCFGAVARSGSPWISCGSIWEQLKLWARALKPKEICKLRRTPCFAASPSSARSGSPGTNTDCAASPGGSCRMVDKYPLRAFWKSPVGSNFVGSMQIKQCP